jgi:transcriptional regulator with XRE-family HTH domain
MTTYNSFVIEGATMMIGNKLKLLRASTGLTQEEFADFLGISRTTYNPIERNRQVPTDKIIEQIEDKLGIKLDDPKIEQFMTIAKPLALAA